MPYQAPVQDIEFVLKHICDVNALADTPKFRDVLSDDIVTAVLTEAGRFATEVIEPLNDRGGREGVRLTDDGVKTAAGFVEAYKAFVEQGWPSVAGDPEYGGQGLPQALAMAVLEMLDSSSMSFSLCPMLTNGAVEALEAHGSDEIKQKYLPKLISGEWTGTMNLTEPHAGSDVGALRSKAVPQGDGTYRVTGTKIFITYGDHDMTENVLHLVLARLPDAPAGTRGISLFLVPKFLVNDDGSLGARNDAKAVGVERKLGINASPTCVMAYGDDGEGAIGYLIGQENRGLAAMFTMMNNARLSVGMQGVGVAESAYQKALDYAQERRQGRSMREEDADDMVAIIAHADVRRMLLLMKSTTEAARALCYLNAVEIDRAEALEDEDARMLSRARADLYTPISKAWSTDMGVEIASLGVQVHGGMGFIEETGAAQFMRDARIAPIYEGTNGIQAIDLVTRKLPLKNGEIIGGVLDDIGETITALTNTKDQRLELLADDLKAALSHAREATDFMLSRMAQSRDDVLAGATAFTRMMGIMLGGWLLGRKALVAYTATDLDPAFAKSRIETALFFAEQVLPEVGAQAEAAQSGAARIYALNEAELAL